MKSFKEYINEETMPFAQTEKGFIGVEDAAVRDNINSLIAGVTNTKFITPQIAFERVSKVLANFHIFPPKQTFMEYDHGIVAVEINQFGSKIGVTNAGEVISSDSSPFYLYFEYEINDDGTFEVFSEVVTSEELDEILSEVDSEDEDGEDELDEEKAENADEDDDEEEDDDEDKNEKEKLDEACWEGYKQVGTKMKNGREVPNCVALEEAVKKLVKEAQGMHLDTPQKGKMASINKLNKEEKSGMPAWYEKEKSKSASLQAATKAKKKEQQKKTDYAIRNMKEDEQLDEISLKTKMSAYAATQHPDADYEYGKKVYAQGDRIRAAIVRKHGEKAGQHADAHAQSDAYGRETPGSRPLERDKLADAKPASKMRTTKAGKINKQDIASKKSEIKSRLAKEETLDEQSKARLAGYIKQASHDVAARSAAVRGFARDADAQRKDKKPMDARKSDERADKMFKKSWNRRQYIAKAVDKLTKEELSPADKGRVAAGYRGSISNPAKQGAIAAYIDDQERDAAKKATAKKAKPKT